MIEAPLQSIECEHCGSSNNAFADNCWVCFRSLTPLSVDGPPSAVVSYPPLNSTSTVLRILGIVFGSLLLVLAFGVALIFVLFLVCVAALTGGGL